MINQEDELYSFVFKGLLTQEALDKAGRINKLVNNANLDSEIVKRLPFELLEEELIAKSRRMATVYTALTAFENSVRDFVSSKLMEEYEEEWWERGVGDKIRKIAETRKKDEERIKWHAQRGENSMNYIDFGNLNSIILNNWQLFEPHLDDQGWASNILKSLERSRNVLMHGGELERSDIERIGTLMKDWISQVGA